MNDLLGCGRRGGVDAQIEDATGRFRRIGDDIDDPVCGGCRVNGMIDLVCGKCRVDGVVGRYFRG